MKGKILSAFISMALLLGLTGTASANEEMSVTDEEAGVIFETSAPILGTEEWICPYTIIGYEGNAEITDEKLTGTAYVLPFDAEIKIPAGANGLAYAYYLDNDGMWKVSGYTPIRNGVLATNQEATVGFYMSLYEIDLENRTNIPIGSSDQYKAVMIGFAFCADRRITTSFIGTASYDGSAPLSTVPAAPTTSTVLVNGESKSFDAYNINNANFFRLRDLAYVLGGTEKQFEVSWDGDANCISLTSGQSYTAVGGEMTSQGGGAQTANPTTSRILKDGQEIVLTAYNINGANYFKLRDVGIAFNFGVDWDGETQTIAIDTSKGYTA